MVTFLKHWVVHIGKRETICYPTLKFLKFRNWAFGVNGGISTCWSTSTPSILRCLSAVSWLLT